MSFEEIIEKMKRIQGILLESLEDNSYGDEIYENLIDFVIKEKINEDFAANK